MLSAPTKRLTCTLHATQLVADAAFERGMLDGEGVEDRTHRHGRPVARGA